MSLWHTLLCHRVIYETEVFKADLSILIIFLFYAFKRLVLVYLGPKTVPHTAFYVSLQCGAGDMAQWVKALAAKPYHLSLIPGTNEVEGGLQLHCPPL